MRSYKSVALLLVLAFLAVPALRAQEARATLLGRISDPSNAVIVAAKVDALNTQTGVHFGSTTNGSGDYIIPFLIPGPYTLTVESQGFRTYSRSGIVIRVNDQVAINVTMEVGQASQTVQVSAETPMLDTSTASMGQVIGSRSVLELPMKDGMVSIMATLTPGVMFTPQSTGYVRPFDTGSPSAMSVDGSRSGNNQFMMDGAPNMTGTLIAYSPPPGVVNEFKVQGASFDAASGFMGGAAINMSLKSGTNGLHGQAYYFMQNPVLNAAPFLSNKAGLPRAPFRLHRWGGSASGPLYLPKLYDGRNKTFWMYGYEGIWSFDPSPWVTEIVPSPAQRSGNLSGLLALGPNYQIYDPYSIAPAAGGRFSRQPLAGNIVPASRINRTGAAYAALWEPANQAGTIEGINNYYRAKNAQDTYWNQIVRVDHNISDKQRFYMRVNFTNLQRPENVRHNKAVGSNLYRYNTGYGIDDVYVVSPRLFLNTRFTLTRFIEGYQPFQGGWDVAAMGFSAAFVNQVNQVDSRALKLPNISFPSATYSSLGGINNRTNYATNVHEFAENITSVVASHTLRYGFVYRNYQRGSYNLGASSGSFTFDATWTRGPMDNSPTAPSSIGQSLASLLYGLPGSGSFPINNSYFESSHVPVLFLQDDWKLSPKLTLSLGLRYERPSPVTERYNRSVRGFDAGVASPIEARALANYALKPIDQIPVSQFKVRGGLTFAGANGQPRTLWKTGQNLLMPRFGFAYSVTPKTVLRGGYGIFYDALGVVNVHANLTGFDGSTEMIVSADNGLNYNANLSNPFPGGFLRGLGAAGGLSTNLGQGISVIDENSTSSYMQRWQFAVQRQLPAGSVIEVSYVGNRGTRMRVTRDLNPTPRQYFSTSPVRDQAAIDFLSAQVPNPFYPLLPRTGLASTNVARSQLLRPYPQFTGVSEPQNVGYSWYHSMQVRLERRFTSGLTATVAYTWAKLMEATGYLNSTDSRPEEVVSDQDRTQRIAITWLYDLNPA